MATTCAYNVFAGAETGLLKGINTGERTWQNLNSMESASRSREITCVCWGNAEKTELCAGLRDNCVVTFDAAGASATEQGPFLGAPGHIKAVSKVEDKFLTGFSGGVVAVWSGDDEEGDSVKFMTGDNLWTMAHSAQDPRLFATGGKENPVKLWDVHCQEPVFTAKNVRSDWLNLRVPVWVTKVQFCPDQRRLVACTGHSQVRVYDPKACRRPVLNFELFKSAALSALAVCPHREDQVVVGSCKGDMGLVDLRKPHAPQLFRGFSGGITDIQCHPSEAVIVSACMDRFVRIHHLDTKALEAKLYLKSRLNCLILSDHWPQADGQQGDKKGRKREGKERDGGDDRGDDKADDTLWDTMEDVKTTTVTGVGEDSEQSAANQKRLRKDAGQHTAQTARQPKKKKKC
ncbi:hypothetical protein ACOMHN_030670 [Nucella lapillus]